MVRRIFIPIFISFFIIFSGVTHSKPITRYVVRIIENNLGLDLTDTNAELNVDYEENSNQWFFYYDDNVIELDAGYVDYNGFLIVTNNYFYSTFEIAQVFWIDDDEYDDDEYDDGEIDDEKQSICSTDTEEFDSC